jgi:hypothetical protein
MQKRALITLQKCCNCFLIKITSYAEQLIKSQVEVCLNKTGVVVLETNDSE